MADSAKQMEIEDGETDEMVVGNLSLYLFLTIRTAQLQHGLRHGDYERYRYAWKTYLFAFLILIYCQEILQCTFKKIKTEIRNCFKEVSSRWKTKSEDN